MNPLATLWIGRCTIYDKVKTTNPNTHQTTYSNSAVATDEPCRVSYKNESTIDVATGVPVWSQKVVLFIRPDLTIKRGAEIEVTQRGVTTRYVAGSTPTKYTYHQEIILENKDEN